MRRGARASHQEVSKAASARALPLGLGLLACLAGCDERSIVGPARAAKDASVGAEVPSEPAERCATALLPPSPDLAAAPLRGGFARDPALDATLNVGASNPYPDEVTAVSATLLADLDGDGRTDLLLNDQRDVSGSQRDGLSRVWIALQRGDGTLGAPERLAEVHSCQLAADLDGDARLDLVCGLNRGGRAVLWGGDGGFDVARSTSVVIPSPTIAAAAWDLDGDGVLDLVLSAFGFRSRVYRGLGARRFEEVTERWSVDVTGNTFQAAFFDFDGDGQHDLYFADDGNAHENRALRLVRGDDDAEPRFERFRPTEPACDTLGFFGTSDASPMGVAMADLNRDGVSELMLATGPELPVLARRREAPLNWIDVQTQLNLTREVSTSGSFLVPWSPVFWDFDHDGAVDLWVATGDDIGFSMMPNRGESRPLIYRGGPGARFREESAALGVSVVGHFAHVALGDLDHDGDLDVVLGSWSGAPIFLRNNVIAAGRHLLLDLRGTVSNPHGLGAAVYVADLPAVHPVGDRWGSWGTAQPTLDLTLPADASRDVLRVRWPSGVEQTVRGPFTSPRLTVTEPAWLTLTPASRHLTAGSTETRTVRVDLAALGARADATVEIDALDPAAPWTGPAARGEDGAWSRTLAAPAAPGSVVLRVRVDGRSMPARPRLWVEAPG
ncbi:MAG: VCBS repeat-containing protein [Polyangiales bacterium]